MSKRFVLVNLLLIASMLLAACASSTPAIEPTAPAEATAAPQASEAPQATDTAEATKAAETAEVEATQAPEATETSAPEAAQYNQSPFLDAQVASAELPAVDERLPENPRVIKGLTDEQGVYGGEMRIGFVGNSPEWGAMLFVAAWEHLVSWKADFSGVEPNLAESIDVSQDATEYTFYLRKGIKWSDGVDFTANDIAFYIEDVMYNESLYPAGPSADWVSSEMADDMIFEKLDDYTFKLTFSKPYGTFLYTLAQWNGRAFAMYPRHYLEQFHKDYNPDVDTLVAEDGNVEDWVALFFKVGPDTWGNPLRWYENTELPSLYPWITTQPLGTGTEIKLARNPYYWKVDEQGNQLPYIDTILGFAFQDAESRTLAMLSGELDFVKDPGTENRVIYHEAMDEGKPLQIKYPQSDGANVNTIQFNQTLADPIKAAVFADKNFRIGMSYAINRQEIIEIVFNGQGTPAQQAPLADSPLYIEGMDTQYVEYDVDKANEYLDKVLPEKNAEGYRLDSAGEPFEIIFTVQNDLSYGTTYVQIVELLIGYWKEVGVKVLLNSMPGPQFDENKKQNTIEAVIFTGEGGAGITPILDPRYYVPMEYFGMFGNGWGYWKTNAQNGEVQVEPPQWAKDARAKYEEVLLQPTEELQIEKMRAVIQDAMDNFYVIGIARNAPMYYVFHERMGGIPDTWYDGWIEGVQKILYPEQWFLRQ
ncbi:MAG: ABC transporter substrate-binding protein [Chloroflexota bacterium]